MPVRENRPDDFKFDKHTKKLDEMQLLQPPGFRRHTSPKRAARKIGKNPFLDKHEK
jgi:hypothetical protein